MSCHNSSVDPGGARVGKPVDDVDILRVAKEVIVKFIEIGRLSPQNFGESFKDVYRAVEDAVRGRSND